MSRIASKWPTMVDVDDPRQVAREMHVRSLEYAIWIASLSAHLLAECCGESTSTFEVALEDQLLWLEDELLTLLGVAVDLRQLIDSAVAPSERSTS